MIKKSRKRLKTHQRPATPKPFDIEDFTFLYSGLLFKVRYYKYWRTIGIYIKYQGDVLVDSYITLEDKGKGIYAGTFSTRIEGVPIELTFEVDTIKFQLISGSISGTICLPIPGYGPYCQKIDYKFL